MPIEYGNIGGVVKHFNEPQEHDGSPKRYVVWARERVPGGDAVDLFVYDFTLGKWVPLASVSSVFRAKTASGVNLSSFSGVASVGGITLVNGDRVLLTAQTNRTQNGLYVHNNGNLTRASNFTGEIAGDHICYILNGVFESQLFYSVNTANAGFLTVGTDNIDYERLNAGVSSSSAPKRWIAMETSDNDATLSNYFTRFVAIFNALPQFEITNNDEIYVKHTYETPAIEVGGSGVKRIAFFKFNKRANSDVYGTGGSQVTINDFIEQSVNLVSQDVRHPDEISLNGMGGYDFGDESLDIIDGDGSTQHDFNKRILAVTSGLSLEKIFITYGDNSESNVFDLTGEFSGTLKGLVMVTVNGAVVENFIQDGLEVEIPATFFYDTNDIAVFTILKTTT